MSTLVRWNPLREMAAVQNAMDRWFDEAWRNVRPTFAGSALSLDVMETADSYTVKADLPGLDSDKINVSVHEGTLTISAEIAQPEVDENVRVLLQERPFGQFSRSINLPQPVVGDKVEASYDDGVLTLVLPKVPEVQPRSIAIKAGKKK